MKTVVRSLRFHRVLLSFCSAGSGKTIKHEYTKQIDKIISFLSVSLHYLIICNIFCGIQVL
jgi:hypothetical protein